MPLKLAIDISPDLNVLHYTLGNVYVVRAVWRRGEGGREGEGRGEEGGRGGGREGEVDGGREGGREGERGGGGDREKERKEKKNRILLISIHV